MGELLGILGEVARVIDFLNEPRHQLEERSGVAIHHRDIKPQNIMLIGQGVKVADFGLSCLDEPGGSARSQCGLTFAYAAPETFRRRVSAGSDQYSLAVTFCQLRSGRLPFVGPPAAVMMGHLFGDPDLSMLPEPERTVVARALAKQPDGRWPDCRSFLGALAGCAAAGSPDNFAADSDLASGPANSGSVESCSVEIPPLPGSWSGSPSDSSDTLNLAVDSIDVSTYCLGAPPIEGPDAFPHGESSSAPTVVVAETAATRASASGARLLAAAALLLVGGVIGWSFLTRPHTHAGVARAVGRSGGGAFDDEPDGDPVAVAIPVRLTAADASTGAGSSRDLACSGPDRTVPGVDRGATPGSIGLDTGDLGSVGRRADLADESPGGPMAVRRPASGHVNETRTAGSAPTSTSGCPRSWRSRPVGTCRSRSD